MFERVSQWLDRDELTADDLVPLTAEREVLDWMAETPVPQRRRPDWLVDARDTPRPIARTHRPRRAAAARWGWAVGLVCSAGVLGMGATVSAIGLAFALR